MNISAPESFGTNAPRGLAGLLVSIAAHPPLNRGMFRMRIAQRIMAVAGGVLDITFRGGKFRIYRDMHPIEYGMLLYPQYNKAELDFLIDGLQAGDVAVDLGSNIGMYAVPMAVKAGPKGKVIAIDPSVEFMNKLKFNAIATGLANIVFENIAVGDKEGQVQLDRVEGNPGTATVSESDSGGITLRPLLAILRDNGVSRIKAMKVDIDGFEEKALGPFFKEAADELLPTRVVIETILLGDDNAHFVNTMLERGYVETGQTRSNALFERQG